MATEDIIVSVGGDVSALKRGLDKGARNVKKFGSVTRADLKRTAARFAKFGAAAAAAAAAAGVVLARQTLKSADAIRKLSIRTGVATDALQELQHAYNLAGVDQQAFNNGLETFGKRLGKARDGFGALKEGLRGSNEQLLQTILASDNTTEALDRIFEAMGKATNEAQRLAIADAAFGGVGLKMTSAFEDGADAFNKARQEAHDLGLVIGEDLLKNAEKMNDDFARASGMIRTQLAAAFLELVGPISKATGALIDFLKEWNEVEAITKRLGETDKFSVAFHNVSERIREIKAELKELKSSFLPSIDALMGGMTKDDLIKDLENELEALEMIRKGMIKTQQEENRLAKETTKEVEKQADAEKEILATRKALFDITSARTIGAARENIGGGRGPFRPGAFDPSSARVLDEGRKASLVFKQGLGFGDPVRRSIIPRDFAFNPGAGDIPQGRLSGATRGQFGMDMAAGVQFGGRALEEDITAQQIEAIKERFKTLEELEVERFQREQALLEERMATETEKQQEHLSLLEQLQKEHGRNMADIRKDKAQREQAIEARNRAMLVGSANQLISEIGRINDEMFKAAQIAGAATALVNAYVAASQALADPTVPFFGKIAAATTVLATGLGFVNAIRSANKGGSAGGGAVVGAGGVPSQPTAEQNEPTRNVFINLRGANRDTRAVIEQINEEIKDGSKLAGITAS